MFDKVLSFLFPNPCVVCGKAAGHNRYVCTSCKNDIYYIGRNSVCKTCLLPVVYESELCPACQISMPPYERLISCAAYEGALRHSLHRYKFFGKTGFASSFSKMLLETLVENGCADFDVVVPIPLSLPQLKERGYNQSALIATRIAEEFDKTLSTDALIKVKHTKRQSGLHRDARFQNIRGAFCLQNEDAVRGKHVLLVDDIFTTGATMREAASVLSPVAKSITACTVARTISNDPLFRTAK